MEIDPKSWDDIPAILLGLQAIDKNLPLRERILDLIKDSLFQSGDPDQGKAAAGKQDEQKRGKVDPRNGRPSMRLWAVLVLGMLKQGLQCDSDRLHCPGSGHARERA